MSSLAANAKRKEVEVQDTKKLNAGIAYLCIQNLDEQEAIPENYIQNITSLADRTEKTELYNADTNNEEIIEQCINLIEEYLKEQGYD